MSQPDPNYNELIDAFRAMAPSSLPSIEALKTRGGQFVVMFHRYFRKSGVRPRGVIHIGGHIGTDLVAWTLLDVEKLLVFEPNPQAFEALRGHASFTNLVCGTLDSLIGVPMGERIHALQLAIGDRRGHVELVVPSNSEFGSVLGLRDSENVEARYSVEMRTLDDVMSDLPAGWRPTDFNVLYMNIEGAELLALRGGRATLEHIELVYTEVNTAPNYPGAPTLDDLTALLAEHRLALGFRIPGGPPNTEYAVFWRR